MTGPSSLRRIYEPLPPWIFRHSRSPEESHSIESHYYNPDDLDAVVRVLRGARMKRSASLMQEFAAAFQFFEGFGENWPALEECLSYLDEWLPAAAYIVVITKPELMLSEESSPERETLLAVLERVGEWWSQPITNNGRFNRGPVAFHTVLEFSRLGPIKSQSFSHLPILGGNEKPLKTPPEWARR